MPASQPLPSRRAGYLFCATNPKSLPPPPFIDYRTASPRMNQGGKPKDAFDFERIRQIIELMEQHDLSEIDLQEGDEKIRLKRGGSVPIFTTAAPLTGQAQAAPTVRVESAAGGESGGAAGTITINSPMVGTYYSKATPESQPFVKVGDRVSEDTIVCIIEAMKVFNEIPAECSGKVIEVLVNDQSPVDFGKPMFRVQPS